MPLDQWMETKEQVRQATDIVDLVGNYLDLRRQGREFVAICPWHDDTRPSMHVNPQRQSFKCFVCDIGGDIFSFVMQMEGLEFREALEMLAERAGIAIQETAERPKPAPGSPDDKPTLYQAMAWVEQTYHRYLLEASEAEPARQYLAERQILPESIRAFHLGFAPNQWDWLLRQAASTPYTPAVLEALGLVVPRKSGDGFYDRFRGRVLFSIRDAHSRESRPIALGGRILPELADDDVAKYINSPETPLFSKNRQVYGLDMARDSIAKSKRCLVVEGYTDCVIAHQCGVQNVVAVLGTALGERHVQLLRRFADSITLVLDGDEAGQRRTNEILELFVAAQVNLQILTLPSNLDPCDFLLSQGSDAFERLLTDAVDALEHKIRVETNGMDLTTDTHRANEALEQILSTLARAPRLVSSTLGSARLREHQVLSRLARTFGPPEEELRKRLTELRRRGRRPQRVDEEASLPASLTLDSWDAELLELIFAVPKRFETIRESIQPDDLLSPVGRAIYARCVTIFDAGDLPDFDRLMLESEDARMKNLLVKLDAQSQAKSATDAHQRLEEVLSNFQRRKEDVEHQRNIAALKDGELAEQQQEELLGNLLAELRTRQGKIAPTEG